MGCKAVGVLEEVQGEDRLRPPLQAQDLQETVASARQALGSGHQRRASVVPLLQNPCRGSAATCVYLVGRKKCEMASKPSSLGEMLSISLSSHGFKFGQIVFSFQT